ncbi:MAG: Gfo/Idh/MocA family oxidoreductase [Clostridiales bacterium]|nr:Gfo/Idh/MocA family oxidoreductase [Clostridiales bacterium]
MKKITVAIAGLGSRGLQTYAKCLEKFSDRAEIVAVADIRPDRIKVAAERYNISPEMCFDSVESMLKVPKLADLMLICTPDDVHYLPAMGALEKGYHLLLEKPAARSVKECRDIAELAERKGLNVVVCHVLRYTVFYQKIKELIDDGRVGDIMNIEAIERVGYWHQAHSFVRGNWHVAADTTPMILAKCCHDMDLMLWLTGKKCEKVTSFGHLSHYNAANLPEGAPERCGDGCPHADTCPYNAQRYYLDCFKRGGNCWPVNVVAPEPTEEKLIEALKVKDYGRCVYRMNNDVVDHQVLLLQLADEATVSFTMSAFSDKGGRCMRIMGTKAEIFADMEKDIIQLMPFGGKMEEFDIRKLATDLSGHGGGDIRMVEDYLDVLEGKPMPSAMTTISRSVESHYVCLAAEESRLQGGQLVYIDEFSKR